MGFFINEKQFVNDNIMQFEQRMNSQYSRFLDKTPNFVTYYHINNIESTTDNGFLNVERILGPDSPIRYNEIKDFPIYGIDQILLDLSDEDEGLNTSYDGDAVILPNTIKPLPNDYFTINYLDKNYLFMVTQIDYDTIKSNNYYKITFTLKSLDDLHREELLKQTSEKYDCILENIGTQEKCIISNNDVAMLLSLNEIYTNVITRYKMLFFNNTYNSFLFPNESYSLYDKYLTHFINNNKLFNEKYNYQTLLLTNEDSSNTFLYEYETSIYRIIEMRRRDFLKPVMYKYWYVTNLTSIFNFYRDTSIMSVSFINGNSEYISSELIDRIINNAPLDDEQIIEKTLISYFNDSVENIYSLNLDGMKNYDYISFDQKSFIMIPMFLFVLRHYYNKFMSIK